jgi:hypothetical protein
VHCIRENIAMKNITLSAPEPLIMAARKRAMAENSTLNAEFRTWLASYSQQNDLVQSGLAALDQIGSYASSGGKKFSRDEMNER